MDTLMRGKAALTPGGAFANYPDGAAGKQNQEVAIEIGRKANCPNETVLESCFGVVEEYKDRNNQDVFLKRARWQ